MNIDIALTSLRAMGQQLIAALPRVGAGALILVASAFGARQIRWVVLRGTAGRFGHENLRIAFGRLAYSLTIAICILFAATVSFPSFTIGSLIQLLGVSGVVVGFAFKDIFQNFLAGILILLTNPFSIDDQIEVDKYEGTVVEIQTRATVIRTFDHRQVVIPNSDMFTKAVTVSTAYPSRRMVCDLAVKAPVDIAAAKRVIAAALHAGIEGVKSDPTADVLVVKMAGNCVTLPVLWWSSSRRADYLIVQDRVLGAIGSALQSGRFELA
ncbi:MAG TPA: mechanosensitive ion channel domain-containing protein [Gemmatimonadaceae bacterium]